MNNIKETLEQRKEQYGTYEDNACLTQALLYHCTRHPNWNSLAATHRETIHMIFHKISRIINGNPDYFDSWHDIAGYATLQANLCNEEDNA